MRTLIVDDESKSRAILGTMIKRYCESLELIGEAQDIQEAYTLIIQEKPELVFLDINMPGGSGFELLERIAELRLQVVFVTAYNEFAIEAFRKDALDYLLKPVNITELKCAADKALARSAMRQEPEGMQHLLEAIRNEQQKTKIAIPERNGLRFINLKDIVRLEAEGSYTRFHLVSGKNILSARNLKEYYQGLPQHLFFRVHHSHIINLEHITFYERGEGGTVVMSDNSSISLAKRKKKSFLELFRGIS